MNKILLTAVSAFLLAGCATVVRGTTNQVQVTSEPSGAQARTTLGHSCTTPCTLTIERKLAFSVIYTMPGYLEQTIPVNTQVSGGGAAGMAGNILLGGVVGVVADAATGAGLDHVPNPVHAILAKAPSGKPARVSARR